MTERHSERPVADPLLLFSGMDFSGKSTLAKGVSAAIESPHVSRHRFLAPVDPIQGMIDAGAWLPRPEFVQRLLRFVVDDRAARVGATEFVLQDSLWFLKFAARLLTEEPNRYRAETEALLDIAQTIKPLGSFYLTASHADRVSRLYGREVSGAIVTKSDRLVRDRGAFEATDLQYRALVDECFPNTVVLDSSSMSPTAMVACAMSRFRGPRIGGLSGGGHPEQTGSASVLAERGPA